MSDVSKSDIPNKSENPDRAIEIDGRLYKDTGSGYEYIGDLEEQSSELPWHTLISSAAFILLAVLLVVNLAIQNRKLRKRITELEARINQPPKSM